MGGLLAIPYRQVQRARPGCPHFLYSKALPCSHVANQLVNMRDLKQGLGPSGTDGPRKLTYNKYKLKVSVLGSSVGYSVGFSVGSSVGVECLCKAERL